jgi:hypothetical protein
LQTVSAARCIYGQIFALFAVKKTGTGQNEISTEEEENFYRRENFRLPKRKKISTEEEISGYRRENFRLPKKKFSATGCFQLCPCYIAFYRFLSFFTAKDAKNAKG